MAQPTHPGQAVKDTRTGRIGITTDYPKARTPRIGVMFLGGKWEVAAQLADLNVIEIVEAL